MGRGRGKQCSSGGGADHHHHHNDNDTDTGSPHVTFFVGLEAAHSHSPLHNNNNNAKEQTHQQQQKKKKVEELKPHPVKDQLSGLDFCVNSPPSWRLAILFGFQHYVLSLGAIVLIPSILVPLMGGGNVEKAKVIQSLLLVSGLNTLMQTYIGSRLPTVVVPSHNFILPVMSIIQAHRSHGLTDPQRFQSTMRAIQGALIISASVQALVGFLGLWRLAAMLLNPLTAVPLVAFSGLGLFYLGLPLVASCAEYGIPAIFLFVFISQYLPQLIKSEIRLFGRFALLLAAVIIWILAIILTASGVYDGEPGHYQLQCRTDRAGIISGSLWVYMPYPFQWGKPTFSFGEAVAMIAASVVTLVESSGAMIATARYGGATPIPPSVFGRGAGWLGIGSLLNAFCGTTVGSTLSAENAGLIGLTKSGSLRVVRLSAGCMLLFSVSGKIGAVLASIPLPVLVAAYFICYAYVAAAGFSHLQFCNLNNSRNTFILGFSIIVVVLLPQYLWEYPNPVGAVHTHARWFNDTVAVILSSRVTMATLVAVALDRAFALKDRDTRQENGMLWWEKYLPYNKDPKTQEYYSLPLNLDKYFPSV